MIRDEYEKTGKWLLLNNEQRRKLAILAKPIVKHGFRDVIQIFTPETLMKWYKKLVARDFDSSKVERKPRRPENEEWRREWDSNPRYLAVRRFSRPLP